MNNDNVFFTIITVCYNSEFTIQRTITSVLNQTIQNYEYIIIDGNSTDNTLKIIESNKSKFNGRLKYLSEPDDGIYFAMNKGLSMAKGKYVSLLNSDDWYEPNTLDIIQRNYNINQNIDIFYGLLNYYKNNKFYKTECYHHNFLSEESLPHPTCFISNDLYKRIGLYNTKFTLASDYEFLLRCRKNDSSFMYIPEILANFSWDGSTIIYLIKSKKEALNIKYKYSIINKKQYLKSYINLVISNFLLKLRNMFFFWL